MAGRSARLAHGITEPPAAPSHHPIFRLLLSESRSFTISLSFSPSVILSLLLEFDSADVAQVPELLGVPKGTTVRLALRGARRQARSPSKTVC